MISVVLRKSIWYVAGLSLLFFIYMMGGLILPYTSGSLEIDFLLTKQFYIHLSHYRWSFYLHIFSSLFVLAAGLTQFSGKILRLSPIIHRWIGKMYVFIVLCISAPAAFVMSFYANGGELAMASFILLSGLWWWFTFKGFQLIRKRKVVEHRAFMIRSYALSLSAVTLRVIQFAVAYFTDWDYEQFYTYNAWISWMFNLGIAEIYLRKYKVLNMKHESPPQVICTLKILLSFRATERSRGTTFKILIYKDFERSREIYLLIKVDFSATLEISITRKQHS